MKTLKIVPLLIVVGFAVSLTSAFQVDAERTDDRAERSNDRNVRFKRIRHGVANVVAEVIADVVAPVRSPSHTVSATNTTTKTPARPAAASAPIRAQTCGITPAAAKTRAFGNNLIVGGTNADVSEFSYIASMRIGNSHACGASILNERWVLTAAHCVHGDTEKDPSKVNIFYGVTKLDQKDGFSSKVTEVRTNNYNPDTMERDVALMRLATPITNLGTKNVNTICLPAASNSTPPEGQALSACGWGTLTSGGSSLPNNLQKVILHTTSRSTCTKSYPNNPVDISQFCMLDKGKDTCQGDSGGPVVMKQANGQDLLVGIVSWGIGCAQPRNPGVYSTAAWHMDWINSNIAT